MDPEKFFSSQKDYILQETSLGSICQAVFGRLLWRVEESNQRSFEILSWISLDGYAVSQINSVLV